MDEDAEAAMKLSVLLEIEALEPFRWSEINEGHLSQIELDALEPKVMTLHRLLIHRTS